MVIALPIEYELPAIRTLNIFGHRNPPELQTLRRYAPLHDCVMRGSRHLPALRTMSGFWSGQLGCWRGFFAWISCFQKQEQIGTAEAVPCYKTVRVSKKPWLKPLEPMARYSGAYRHPLPQLFATVCWRAHSLRSSRAAYLILCYSL